jgi:hypothetical protein
LIGRRAFLGGWHGIVVVEDLELDLLARAAG